LSYSLNRGLERAKGKFIARMDDDDFSIPNRFAVQLDFMEKNPDVVVVGAPRFANLENDQYLRTKQLELYMKSAEVPHIVQENDAAYNAIRTYFEVPFLHPSAFIRKDFLDTHGIRYKEIYESAEDTAFWFEITQKGGKIIQSDVPLVLRGRSHKKKGYHVRQLSSYHRFLEYSVSEVYELPKEKNRWLTHDEVCGILTGLEKYIGYKPFITESTLEYAKLKQKCQ
jgi:glycosyltransferase involved in cell wall biosynthesis